MFRTTLKIQNYGSSELKYFGYGVSLKIPANIIGDASALYSDVPAEYASAIATDIMVTRPEITVTIGATFDDGVESGYQSNIKNNFDGDGAPTVNDDITLTYAMGSKWVNKGADPVEIYECVDASEGAAIWIRTAPIIAAVKNNFDGADSPTAAEDSTAGYSVGSKWVNKSTEPVEIYECIDATEANAIWIRTAPAATTIMSNFDGAVAPTVNDDVTEGYSVGSKWVDKIADPIEIYECIDASEGAAIWIRTTSAAAAQNNFGAATAPTAGNDITEGYTVGSKWVNMAADPIDIYECVNASEGAAVWVQTTSTALDLSSPGPIGGTTPDIGNFTSLVSNGLTQYGTAEAVADDGTITLPEITAGGFGMLAVGQDEARAIFTVDAFGNITLMTSSGNVVANADTDGRICIGTSVANPVIIRNRLGASKVVIVTVWYN